MQNMISIGQSVYSPRVPAKRPLPLKASIALATLLCATTLVCDEGGNRLPNARYCYWVFTLYLTTLVQTWFGLPRRRMSMKRAWDFQQQSRQIAGIAQSTISGCVDITLGTT
jgi:hypothetical protein